MTIMVLMLTEGEVAVDALEAIDDAAAVDPCNSGRSDCRVCHKMNPTEQLIRCSGCDHMYHRIRYVTPAVYDNIFDWTYGECGGQMDDPPDGEQNTLDITEDQATLACLKERFLSPDASPNEVKRIKRRAQNIL